jgi:hypothetical protein
MIEMQPNETEMFQTVAKTVVPILLCALVVPH